MKKKLTTVALVVAVIAIMVSGTLAYFTDTDEVTNTFTVGSVLIEIWENGSPTPTDKVVFEKPLVPVVNVNDVTRDPGYAAKVVKVENTGNNAAYIRTHIAVPTALINYLELRVSLEGWVFNGTLAGSGTARVDGVDYTVFTYDHTAAVDPGQFTAELLQGAYLKSDADVRDNPDTEAKDLEFCKRNDDGSYTFSGFVAHTENNGTYTSATVTILVASQAIQAQGFENGTATDALNAGFGENTNPWQ